MSGYYTNVVCGRSQVFYRGVDARGRRIRKKVNYSPTLFLKSNEPSQYKSLTGENLKPMEFSSIRDARDFIDRYRDVENFSIYGNNRYECAMIADEHPNIVEWDINKVVVAYVDIEVGSENGFPDPYEANEPITAIGISTKENEVVVFGCGDYTHKETDTKATYIKCLSENDLCKRFLHYWEEVMPDVITGWNVKFFDIPYLVNRFRKVVGEKETRRFSPWNLINERKVFSRNQQLTAYNFVGIATLDYIELYRWYAPAGKSQESYALNNIANVEIGEKKISYDEFDNLHQLYRLNYQKFIEYNIKDVCLVQRLEQKLKLIELAITLAYDTKSNYDDVFTQTRMWDSLTYAYLKSKNIIVPPKTIKDKAEAFEGAYVKEPQVGLHGWVASFDLNSLYPHLMMQYNISPETLVDKKDWSNEMQKIIDQDISVDRLLTKQIDLSGLENHTMTPNGQFFSTTKRGFLPQMLEEMYVDRKKFKKLMLKAEQEYENETDSKKKAELSNLIARYNNLQLAKKVSLNSAYGALGSKFFRFYDLRQALGVTKAGQLSIRWIENKVNEYMNTILKTDKVDYVIASDTDSIYLRMGELVEKVFKDTSDTDKIISFMDKVCEDKIQPFIDKSYQELADYVNAYEQKMQMKREGLSNKGIWTAKKRYILNVFNNEGVQYTNPKMKVMGLEMIKSSTPSAIRQKMKELIKLLMNGTEDDIHNFIADFREKLKTLPPEEISFPRSLNGLKNYSDRNTLYKKGTPIHVKGAILYNHYLEKFKLDKKYPKIQEGEKIKFTYLKQPNPFKDTVISYPGRLPKEFKLDDFVNYEMQFEKAFIEPIRIILDCVGWTTEKTNSLEDFFG